MDWYDFWRNRSSLDCHEFTNIRLGLRTVPSVINIMDGCWGEDARKQPGPAQRGFHGHQFAGGVPLAYHLMLLCLALLISPTAYAADTTGPARIVDGDTIHIGDTKIRLHGIDAPEKKQECKDANGNPWMAGQDATAFLKSLTDGKEVSCSSHGKDKYGRVIGSCEVGDLDINRAMVVAGLARAYRQYSERYLYEEHGAMRNKAGMWGGECEPPWEWRRK